MTILTPSELEEIEAREKAATPGPWICTDDPVWCVAGPIVGREEDADFMAAARTDIPRLLEHVQEVEKQFSKAIEILYMQGDAAVQENANLRKALEYALGALDRLDYREDGFFCADEIDEIRAIARGEKL